MSFDVIIIGSGAGGGMAALELCKQGLTVALLERGARFNPKTDYIQNYPDWETRHNPLAMAYDDEQTINLSYRSPSTIGNNTAQRAPFKYLRVHGLGGSTLHYQGEAHRFAEHDFSNLSMPGHDKNWPIEYSILEPYYQRVENLLGVAGEKGNAFLSSRGHFPTPAHSLSPKSRILAESARRAGMTLRPNTLALPSRSIDGRLPCQHSGGCNYGCVFGAKSSIDQAIIPLAEKTGNLTILSQTRATKIKTEDNGDIRAIECKQGDQTITLSARAYVLAMGAIETPRLMLHSTSTIHPNGFANAHDQLGRYFMETVIGYLPITLSSNVDVYIGPPLDSRIWDFSLPKNGAVNGFVLGTKGYLHRRSGPISTALTTPGIGLSHKRDIRQGFGKALSLFGIAEQEPRMSNKVFLSDKLDTKGVPLINVHCTYSNRDKNTLDLMGKMLKQWAKATDTKMIGDFTNSLLSPSATHVGGGCRMGTDPRQSVTDSTGKIHGINNAYICDASVLVTQGSGNSPSLTIQALALRTAEKIALSLQT